MNDMNPQHDEDLFKERIIEENKNESILTGEKIEKSTLSSFMSLESRLKWKI